MSELEFPELDAAPAAGTALAEKPAGELSLETMDLTKLALTGFAEARTAVATAMSTLEGVQHDLSTPTKLIEAKTLRQRLVNAPLATARKVSSGIKSKLTEASKAVGAELVKIEADFAAADALITPQIDAAQQKLDEERRQREDAEAARVEVHKTNLAKLAGYVEFARGLPSARIADGIEKVSGIELDPKAWEEFYDRAVEQKSVTLDRMKVMLAEALEAEAEARRLAEEKAEQERKAAELAAKEAEIAAAASALAKQQAEFAAQQAAAAAKVREEEEARAAAEQAAQQKEIIATAPAVDAAAAPAAHLGSEETPASGQREASPVTPVQGSQQVLKAEASTPDATDRDASASTSPSVGSMGAGQAADAAPSVAPAPEVRAFVAAPAANESPTLTLGRIGTLLGFAVTADFLTSLGFVPVVVKASRLYKPSDFPLICAAISRHVLNAGVQHKAAA